MTSAERIRRFLQSRGGRAFLSDIYDHLAGESPALSVRAARRSLDWLASRGEVRIEHGLAVYTPQPETRGRKGTAHKRLWRAAHRCSLPG